MDYRMLMKAEVLARAKEVWQEHPRWTKDKRKRWALALGRIRKLLMEVRDEERRREEEGGVLEERVEIARRRAQYDQSDEARELFEQAITSLRQKEHEEAERCEIVGAGRRFKYLGVSTSSPIDEKTITEEIVQKLMRKLKHWSNRLLSWPAKTVLLKHVLAATPLYLLMSVGLCRDGLEELERLCRNFLWGWNEEGNPKTSLIAWERIAQEKGKGGLGWTSFKNMADALNVRLVGRILEGGNTEWIQLARSFILRTLRKGSYQREHIQ
ncbi:hypothetical protein R1sor_025779 [Riccia sorocarpa]|uniref:Reverse transcriptase n=1 Tax=Riccia sorocarpa TaxID=122646 RepID=A0ABD3GAY2_9MARC